MILRRKISPSEQKPTAEEPFTLSRLGTLEEAGRHRETLADYIGGAVTMNVLSADTPEQVALCAAIMQAENTTSGMQTAASGSDGYDMLIKKMKSHADAGGVLVQLSGLDEETVLGYMEYFTDQQQAARPNPEQQ